MRCSTFAVWLGAGCFTFVACGPQAGTESGNPINPPTPPSEVFEGPDLGLDEAEPSPFDGPGDVDSPAGPDEGSPFEEDVPEPEPASMPEPPSVEEPAPDITGQEPDIIDRDPSVDGPPSEPPASESPEPAETPDAPNLAGGAPSSAEDPSNEAPQPGTAVPSPTSTTGSAPGEADGSGMDSTSPCDPTMCQNEATAVAQTLSEPIQASDGFDAAECQLTSTGSICACSGPSGIVTVVTDSTIQCVVQGRFGCLFESAEFMGCEPMGEQCAQVCADISARQAEDDARSAEVEVRAALCFDDGSCGYVLSSDQECWAGGPSLTSVDCSMSDEEILGTKAATSD